MSDKTPIGFVETCYDMSLSLQERCRFFLPQVEALAPKHFQTAVFATDIDDHGRVRILAAEGEETALQRGYETARVRPGPDGYPRATLPLVNTAWRACAKRSDRGFLLSDLVPRRSRVILNARNQAGSPDGFLVTSQTDVDAGPTFVVLCSRKEIVPLSAAEHARWSRLRAHLETSMRLQRRLVETQSSPTEPSGDGAVLRANGQLVHAEGEARSGVAREALQRSVLALDQSRRSAERSQDSSLDAWRGLVDGSWSLVERFDRDGRRFYVAHRNPPNLRDPRGLTKQQARVASLAARGFSNKLIGYYLGLSELTVASHLAAAQSKLGLATRASLVREFSPGFARRLAEQILRG